MFETYYKYVKIIWEGECVARLGEHVEACTKPCIRSPGSHTVGIILHIGYPSTHKVE